MLAKASGADVIIFDTVDHSLAMARELGADEAVNSSMADPVAAAIAFAGGRGADLVFECAGGPSMPTTLPLATKMARRGSKVVIVGGFEEGETSIALEWQQIQKSEIQLIPSASFAMHGIYRSRGRCSSLSRAAS